MRVAPPAGWSCTASWPSCRALAAAAAPPSWSWVWQQGWVDISSGCIWGPGPFTVQVAEEAAVRHDEVWSWGPVAYILMFPHGQAFKDAGFMQRVYDAGCRRGWKAQPVNEETTIQLTVLKSLGLLSGVSNCDLPWITFPARPEVTHFLVKHAQPQGFMCHICHLGSTNGKTCNQLQLQITSFQLRMSNIRTPKTIKKNYLKWHFHEMIIITLWIFRPLKCWYP